MGADQAGATASIGGSSKGETGAIGMTTRPEDPPRGWSRFEQTLRVAVGVLILGIVVAGGFGLLGLRISEATAETADLRLTVTYADITRAGLATPLVVSVETIDGTPLPAVLEIGMSTSYRAMFDENGLVPEPDAITSDGTTDTWTYLPDGAHRLVVSFDARVQPDIHSGRSTDITVSAPDAPPLAVTIHTRVWA